MDPELRRAWTQVVTAADYEQHMAAIGQAQAAADLTRHILLSADLPHDARVVIAGAGTGQMFDFLDPDLLRPYRLTCTDLNREFLRRLEERLAHCGLCAAVLQDDIEQTAIQPAPDLLLATLLLEHIDWRRGVEVFATLHPGLCAVILQENPPGMISPVTPGRRLPPSMAKAMETAHPALIAPDDLTAAFAARGYRCRDVQTRPVADGKHLLAAVFTP